MTEHIGRLSAIGIGFENPSARGTSVNAGVRIPKTGGSLKPEFEEAVDDSSYGVIDEVFDSETTKNFSKLPLEGIIRDDLAGYLFAGALGSYKPVKAYTGVGGFETRGDVVYQGVDFLTATRIGVIQKIQVISGPITLYWVSTTSGTLADATDIKKSDDTRTSTSVDTTTYMNAKGHFFSRQNDNAHPTFTIYDTDPVGQKRSSYGMVNSLEITCEVGDYAKFTAEFRGKKMETTTTQNPTYTTQTEFISRDVKVYFANTEALLNSATGSCLQNFKVNFNKNLKEIQCFGSDDIDSIHNQQFTIDGDMEAIFDSETLRDYVTASTKKAFRMEMINATVPPIVAGIYPSIIIDGMKAGFNSWDKSDANNDIVTQTLGYSGQFDTTTNATVEILLITDTATVYKYV